MDEDRKVQAAWRQTACGDDCKDRTSGFVQFRKRVATTEGLPEDLKWARAVVRAEEVAAKWGAAEGEVAVVGREEEDTTVAVAAKVVVAEPVAGVEKVAEAETVGAAETVAAAEMGAAAETVAAVGAGLMFATMAADMKVEGV